jgi:hypothetical protein
MNDLSLIIGDKVKVKLDGGEDFGEVKTVNKNDTYDIKTATDMKKGIKRDRLALIYPKPFGFTKYLASKDTGKKHVIALDVFMSCLKDWEVNLDAKLMDLIVAAFVKGKDFNYVDFTSSYFKVITPKANPELPIKGSTPAATPGKSTPTATSTPVKKESPTPATRDIGKPPTTPAKNIRVKPLVIP